MKFIVGERGRTRSRAVHYSQPDDRCLPTMTPLLSKAYSRARYINQMYRDGSRLCCQYFSSGKLFDSVCLTVERRGRLTVR